jgi:hypothetical protein
MKEAADDSASAPQIEPEGSALTIAFWGLLLFVGCRVIQIFLATQSMASSVAQAVLAEWGAGRLGVTWTAPDETLSPARSARRAAEGAGMGVAVAALVLGVLVASRGAMVSAASSGGVSLLVVGFVGASLTAWRDEMILHGIPLRALQGTSLGAVPKALACGITSAGYALGRTDASPRTVFVAALVGVLLGLLWVRDRGVWQPWAAHAALRFATGTLFSGGLLQVRLADSTWAGGDGGMLAGTAAVIAIAPVAVLALVRTAGVSPRSGNQG